MVENDVRRLLVLSTVIATACVALLSAQSVPSDEVELLSPRYTTVEAGEQFLVRFLVPWSDPRTVEVGVQTLPSGIERGADGPLLVSRGRQTLEVELPLVAREAGRYIVEPLWIRTPTMSYQTPDLLVDAVDPRGGAVPFRALWSVLRTPIYQGQSVPVVIKIAGIDTFAFPSLRSFRAPENGLFEEIGGVGTVDARQIAGVNVYEIPVASFLFTPTEAGEVILPSASVAAVDQTAEVPPMSIRVLPVPSVIESSGAVGRYRLTVLPVTPRIGTSGSGEVVMRMEGVGNLPLAQFPEVTLEGATQIGRSERSEVNPDRSGLSGYEGWREQTIRFEPLPEVNSATITIAPFRSFDPYRRTVDETPAQTISVTVVTHGGEEGDQTVALAFPLFPIDKLSSLRWVPLARVPWFGTLFLVGPLAYLIVRLVKRKRFLLVLLVPAVALALSVPRLAYDALEIAARPSDQAIAPSEARELLVRYETALESDWWHAGLHYNAGVLASYAGDRVRAVSHLRRALRIVPELTVAREALTTVEARFGVTEGPVIPRGPRPIWPAGAVLAAWTAAWFLALQRDRFWRGFALAPLIVVIVVGGGWWWWSATQTRVTDAVVVERSTVRRIPDESAQPWITVDQATAVEVELSYEGFLLVRTATGVTGWVAQEALLIQGDA